MNEVWKPVPFEPFGSKYIVSNLGRVKPIKKSKFSNAKGECLKYGIGSSGYGCVTLYHNGLSKQCFVHQLVALSFIDKPEGKNLVCHTDDNKLNNVFTNLRWGDAYDNMRDMVEHRRSLAGSKHPNALLNEVKVQEIRKLYREGGVSQTSLALRYGVDQTTISKIILRQSWVHTN